MKYIQELKDAIYFAERRIKHMQDENKDYSYIPIANTEEWVALLKEKQEQISILERQIGVLLAGYAYARGE